MNSLLVIFAIILGSLALIGWLADRRAADKDPGVTPGLSLLPGDLKYESSDGKIRIYFPIVTSIILSLMLSVILRFFG
jgi:Protein of unknown function (DUF2905)